MIEVNLIKLVKIWMPIILCLSTCYVDVAMGAELKGKIAFSTQHELVIINLEKEHGEENPMIISLPHKLDTAHHPEWMPKGEKIIFEFTQWNEHEESKKYLAVVEILSKKICPFNIDSIENQENICFPKWSPNGRYLTFVEHGKNKVTNNDNEKSAKKQNLSKLIVYDSISKEFRSANQFHATESPLSWSSDNKKIAFCTSDDGIAIYSLDDKTNIIVKGWNPVFNPATDEIYYIGKDSYLHKIDINNETDKKVGDTDWNWYTLIGFSKDGSTLFFIGGGSFLLSEYSSIDAYNIKLNNFKRLSSRYPIIHGASLYED